MTPPTGAAAPMIVDTVAVVDTDSHLTEVPDLWTSRLASKWRDVAPSVRYIPRQGEDYWFIGGQPTHPAWTHSRGSWGVPPPSHPRVFAEVEPATYDPEARAGALDDFGVAVQVLYPNIVAFNLLDILGVGDRSFANACLFAYNDYVAEFAAAVPGRYVPIMALPMWDLDGALAELERAAALGHKGIVWANRPEVVGAPPITDPAWDPLWARAEEAGLSINFHVGFGEGFGTKALFGDDPVEVADAPPVDQLPPGRQSAATLRRDPGWVADYRLDLVRIGNKTLLSNSNALIDLILSGVCERFPSLPFVSVESGFGYFPFVLESADWNWVACGASTSLPERLLPSEYFRRQCYTTFWFEHQTVTRLADLYPDNLMFETDFPHVVSLTPGAGNGIKSARDTIEANLSSVDPEVRRKILSDNARRVYGLAAEVAPAAG